MGQQPSMNQKKLCALCNVNAPNAGYKWCLPCYKKMTHARCIICNVNAPSPGYKRCLPYYRQPTTPTELLMQKAGIPLRPTPADILRAQHEASVPQSVPPPCEVSTPETCGVSSKKVRIDVWNTWIGAEVGVTKCPLCNLTDIQQGACNGWDCAHVVPKCAGGETTIDNLRPTCKGCNSSMAGKDLREFCKFYPGSLERLSLIENRHPRTKR
jgi:hypothetical protein